MKLQTSTFTLVLDDANGAILSIMAYGQNFTAGSDAALPLAVLRLRDDTGGFLEVDTNQAAEFGTQLRGDGVALLYTELSGLPLDLTVELELSGSDGMCRWRFVLENRTDRWVEWIELPGLIVPNDLAATGGSGSIVWPGFEGLLVEDAALREQSWLPYQEPGYPTGGTDGVFPGAVAAQFMAYCRGNSGLYIGAHDDKGHVKGIDFCRTDGGIKLQLRLFLDGFESGVYRLAYDVVLGVFKGGWHEAADIYRRWYQFDSETRAVPIAENPNLPAWYGESPVVVAYPVRGHYDTDEMLPNRLFPYTNALPHIDRLAREINGRILVLLMHWEGTAPWAPPYVWPPYGGEEALERFSDELHKRGHILGVYCSGIGWTEQSNLIASYNRKAQFDEQCLSSVVCLPPDNDLTFSSICPGQRRGYDLCPGQDFTKDTMADEFAHMVDGGCDYIQIMDQNHGGGAYFCYSREHDHPKGPGKWQTDEMQALFGRLRQVARQKGKSILIGCETVCAEPFIADLPLNDARFNINYLYGTPIPLYAYIYHKYINNFMGNQVTAHIVLDHTRSPDNLLFRQAYSFIAGDLPTMILNDEGQATWNWGILPTEPLPEQEPLLSFIRSAVSLRNGPGKKFLHLGEMLKPFPLSGVPTRQIYMHGRPPLETPAVLTSRWIAADRSVGQAFANFTDRAVCFELELPPRQTTLTAALYDSCGARAFHAEIPLDQPRLMCRVEPHAVALAEIIGL